MKKLLPTLLLLTLPALGHAQALDGMGLRPFLNLGLTGGGDAFDRFLYSNGTTKSVKAGGLIHFAVGLDMRFDGPFSAQLNLGYHADQASGSDGKFTFERFPLEVLGHWRLSDQMRLGGGLRWAQSAKIDSRGSLGGRNADFKSSTGLVLEGEYFVKPQLGLKLRYVNEKYTDKAAPNREFSGNHIGGFATLYFR